MAFISLPALVQKVLIDTKSIKEARAESTAFATKFIADMKAIDRATDAHVQNQKRAATSTQSLIKSHEQFRKSIQANRKALTDFDRSTTASIAKNTRYVRSLNDINRALAKLKDVTISTTVKADTKEIATATAKVTAFTKYVKKNTPQRIVIAVDTRQLGVAREKVKSFTQSNRDSLKQTTMTAREYEKVVKETTEAKTLQEKVDKRLAAMAEREAINTEIRRRNNVKSLNAVSDSLLDNTRNSFTLQKGLLAIGHGFRKGGDDAGYFRQVLRTIKIPAVAALISSASTVISAGLGGIMGILTQYGPVITGVTGAVVNLVKSLFPLTGAFAAIPVGLLALKSSAAVFKSLVGDSTSAAEAIAKYGANSAQAKRALESLSPTARGFVKELGALRREYAEIQKAGQAVALPKFQTALRAISPLMKTVRSEFVNVSNLLGTFSVVLTRAFTMKESRTDLSTILKTNTRLIGLMLDAATPLAVALRNVMAAAGPMVTTFAKAGVNIARSFSAMTSGATGQKRLTDFFKKTTDAVFSLARTSKSVIAVFRAIGRASDAAFGRTMVKSIEDVTSRMAAFLQKASVQETLERGFVRGSVVAKQFGRTIRDLGVTVKNVMSAASKGIGIDFVGGLEGAAARMREFTSSVRGGAKITTFFKGTGPVLREVGSLVKDILKDFMSLGNNSDVAGFVKSLRTDVLPAVFALTDGIAGRLGPAISNLLQTFTKFLHLLTFSPLIEVVNQFATLASKVLDFVNLIPGMGAFVATVIALGVAGKGVSTAIGAGLSSVQRFAGFVTTIGAKGTVGAAGLAGLAQGIRAVNAAAATTPVAPAVVTRGAGGTAAVAGAAARRRAAESALISAGSVTRANALGSALATGATRTAALKKGLGALTGFLGGPWGIAIAAGVTGLIMFSNHQAKAKQTAADLKAAVEADTGAIGEHTRAVIVDTLQQQGKFETARKVGISEKTLTDATLGNADAQKVMSDRLGELRTQYNESLKSGSRVSVGYADQVAILVGLIKATGAQTGKIGDLKDEYFEHERALTGLTEAEVRQQEAMRKTADRYKEAKDKVDGFKTSIDNLVNSFTILREGALDSTTANIAKFAAKRTLVEGAKGGKSLNEKTERGATNVTNLLDLAKAGQDQIQADLKNNTAKLGATAAAKLAKKQTAALRKEIFDAAVKDAGLNAKKVNAILDEVFKPRKDINVQVDAIITEDTKRKVADFEANLAAFDAARYDPTIEVNDLTATRQMNGILSKLGAIDGYTATATVNVTATGQGVLNKIKTQLEALDREPQAATGGYFRKTGYVRGPGGPTDDKIRALISDREFVIKAAAVQKYGVRFFSDLNQMRFAEGGVVRKPSSAFGTHDLTPSADRARKAASGPPAGAQATVPVQQQTNEFKFYGDFHVADLDSVLRKAEREANLAALATGGNGTEGGGW